MLKPLPFDEAIAWAESRGVVLPDVYYSQLQGVARAMAFSIAGISALDQLSAVKDSLTQQLQEGVSFQDWKKQAAELLPVLPAHRVETIFRTNIQGNYARGRCEQQRRHTDTRPLLMYDAINDSRTRPAHAAMDGFVAPYDDPTWKKWRPPCGYNCRCRVIALTEKQAEKYKALDTAALRDPSRLTARVHALAAGPDTGWDYDVCSAPDAGVKRVTDDRLHTLRQGESTLGGLALSEAASPELTDNQKRCEAQTTRTEEEEYFPYRVFHGTGKDFDSFDLGKLRTGADAGGESFFGDGVYLSGQGWKASAYAHAGGEAGQIMVVDALVKKPLVIHGTDAHLWARELKKLDIASDLPSDKITEHLRGLGYDSVIVLKNNSKAINELVVFDASKTRIIEKIPVSKFKKDAYVDAEIGPGH